MRIIGGHDYYDGAGFGVDETCTLLRSKSPLHDLESIKEHPFKLRAPMDVYASKSSRSGHNIRPFLVILAGEIHPGLEVTTHSHQVRRPDGKLTLKGEFKEHLYGSENALAAFDQISSQPGFRLSYAWSDRQTKKIRQKILDHMARTITPEETTWILDNKVAILTTDWEGSVYSGHTEVKINHANLKDLEFYKCVDPATAHMRLANFISGVLPTNRETIEISDKDRIRKAGFDTVTSFRKGPTGKKSA